MEYELHSPKPVDPEAVVELIARESSMPPDYRKISALFMGDDTRAEKYIGIFTGPNMITIFDFGFAEHEIPGRMPDISVRYEVDLRSKDKKKRLFTISGKRVTAELIARMQEALNEEPRH